MRSLYPGDVIAGTMRPIFALLVITAVCGCAKSPTSERIAQAQNAIAATLRDPSSAQFKDVREARPRCLLLGRQCNKLVWHVPGL
jgi:hypothetical protein